MTYEQAWLRAALLGTSRVSQQLEAGPGLTGELIEELAPGDAEGKLLGALALLSVRQRSGWRLADPQVEPIALAPADERPAAPVAVGAQLRKVLDAVDLHDLLPEFLGWLHGVGLRIPSAELPSLLDHAADRRHLWEDIIRVAGARGRWLAEQNPAWGFVLTTHHVDPDVLTAEWSSLDFGARQERLASVRAREPARARRILEGVWCEEPARHRAQLTEILQVALSADDEPFLETQLDDPGAEVRRTAVLLLGRLPSSRYAERMCERALHHLSIAGGRLLVELPGTLDEPTRRDGLDAKAMDGDGPRASVLSQIIAGCPPSTLAGRLGWAPDRLLTAASESDWAKVVQGGLLAGALRYRDQSTLELFIRRRVPGEETLWGALEDRRREAMFLERLGQAKDRAAFRAALGIAPRIPGPWSPAMTTRVLDAMAALIAFGERPGELSLTSLLRDAAKKVDPDSADRVEALARSAIDAGPRPRVGSDWRRALQELLAIVRVRRRIREAVFAAGRGRDHGSAEVGSAARDDAGE